MSGCRDPETGAVRVGCCAPIGKAEEVYRAGFDYLEPGVTSLLPDAPDSAFVPILESYRASPLPIGAFNLFLPGDLKIVGRRSTGPGSAATSTGR